MKWIAAVTAPGCGLRQNGSSERPVSRRQMAETGALIGWWKAFFHYLAFNPVRSWKRRDHAREGPEKATQPSYPPRARSRASSVSHLWPSRCCHLWPGRCCVRENLMACASIQCCAALLFHLFGLAGNEWH